MVILPVVPKVPPFRVRDIFPKLLMEEIVKVPEFREMVPYISVLVPDRVVSPPLIVKLIAP